MSAPIARVPVSGPVGDPELDSRISPRRGKPLRFLPIEGVARQARTRTLGRVQGPRGRPRGGRDVPSGGRRRPRLNRLREGFAKLNPVERAAEEGANGRWLDRLRRQDRRRALRGRPRAKDYLLELGEGAPSCPNGEGAGGRERQATSAASMFPSRTTIPAEEGSPARPRPVRQIKVNEVPRERSFRSSNGTISPAEASEFDTLDELREHISGQIREVLDRPERRAVFREAGRSDGRRWPTRRWSSRDPVVHRGAPPRLWRRVERSAWASGGMDPEKLSWQIQGKDPRRD